MENFTLFHQGKCKTGLNCLSASHRRWHRNRSQRQRLVLKLASRLLPQSPCRHHTGNPNSHRRVLYLSPVYSSDLFLLSNCSFGTHVNSTCLSSFSRTVQSRSLQNIQASRVLHAPEPPYSTDDETETLHRHLAADGDLDDIAARMEKLGVTQERSGLDSVSQNYSQEERMDHFHIDPITGHVAALTWDPQRSARLRPHADDM